MTQLNSSHSIKSTPPRRFLPVLTKCIDAYKLWQEYVTHFPKTAKYTLGGKIDTLFIEIIENLSVASFLSKEHKLPVVQKAIAKLDVLKVFLYLAWNVQALDNKKYVSISEALSEPGKMLGGWHNQLVKASEISSR